MSNRIKRAPVEKLLYAEILNDGTKIMHYLKKNGSITIRMHVPKENVRSHMVHQVKQIAESDPQLADDMARLFMVPRLVPNA